MYVKNREFEELAAGQSPGLEDEGGEESSSQVVGPLQEDGPSLVHVVLPSVRLHHNGQGVGSAQIADKG